MKKEMIKIKDTNGNINEVELVSYLISEDESKTYLVYSKGETQGPDQDKVIYISRLENDNGNLNIIEIIDDSEWNEVLGLLKKVANAK